MTVDNWCLLDHFHVPVSQDTEKTASEHANTGKTPIYVVVDGHLAGIICVADAIKETSMETVGEIKGLGVTVYVVIGNNEKTVQYIGKLTHVDQVMAGVLPEDEAQVVSRLQKEGKTVMMMDGGINDTSALVQTDVGCVIGNGSDIALESGDVVLMESDLMSVYRVVKLSKATVRSIKQNLFWASFYNSLGTPVTAGVLYLLGDPLLNPMLGGFAMPLSPVCVMGNTLKLRNLKLQCKSQKTWREPFLSGTRAVSPENSKVKGEDHMNQEGGCTCRHKHREVTEERDLTNRLSRIEGQIRDTRSMVEGGCYYVDIITQMTAVQAALNSSNKVLLERHIESCVVDDIRSSDDDATVEELCRILQKMMK